MTNEELETKKTELEMLIRGLLNRFQEETGFRVTRIEQEYIEERVVSQFSSCYHPSHFTMEIEG